MSKEVCNNRCAACFFLGRSTGTCDYIFIMDRRRPCPPGDKCTEMVTEREMNMRRATWDVEEGKKMHENGMSDAVIADYFRIPTGTVTSYRKKHWENTASASGNAPKVDKPKESSSLENIETVPPAAIQDTGVDEEPADPQEEKLGAGQCDFDFTAGLQVPADPAAAADPAPAGVEKAEPGAVFVPAPEQKPNIMDILAAATDHLNGMKAVCTAGAIQHLMYWRYPEDLRRARDHIDYLLDLLQKQEG